MLKLNRFTPCQNGRSWIEPLDLELGPGQWLMIQGRNGSGRSTVAQALAGHLDHLGEFIFDGTLLPRMNAQQRYACGVTYVPEHRDVFADLNPVEHLHVGLGLDVGWHSAAANHCVQEVLERLPTLQKRHSLAAKHLSGGEQQILSVATALVSQPRCVILDEPFEGLASPARTELLNWLLDLKGQGMQTIWFEQSAPAEVLPHVNHLLFLNQGIWSK